MYNLFLISENFVNLTGNQDLMCVPGTGSYNVALFIHKIIVLAQWAVPLILLILVMMDFISNVVKPSEKNGPGKYTKKIIIAVIVFLVPIFINIAISAVNYIASTEIVIDEIDCLKLVFGGEEK